MTGREYPDAPPPEVPEEFADAYRDAYRKALEAGAEPFQEQLPPQQVVLVGTHRSEHETDASTAARWSGSRWLRPVLLAGLALVLVAGAYAIGTALSGPDKPDRATTQNASTGTSPTARPTKAKPSTSPGGWDGPVKAVGVDAIAADCTAPPSRDSAGRPVTYVPENAIDGKPQTAWRCVGSAVGQKLTLRLAAGTDVAEVGLVPGYAKTDPDSGIDRYAENNRITRVRWTIGDVTVVQRLDPDPSSRALQAIRVPRTTTDTVTLEILAVRHGPRNTTAISEVTLAAAGH